MAHLSGEKTHSDENIKQKLNGGNKQLQVKKVSEQITPNY